MTQIKTASFIFGIAMLLVAYTNCQQGVQFNATAALPLNRALQEEGVIFDIPNFSEDGDDSEDAPPISNSRRNAGSDNGNHQNDDADDGDSEGSDDGKDCRPRKDRVCEVRVALAKSGNRVKREEKCSDESNDSNKCAVICHVPPGNPENAETIIVGLPAVDTHEDHHDDYPGPCEEQNPQPQPDDCENDEDEEESSSS